MGDEQTNEQANEQETPGYTDPYEEEWDDEEMSMRQREWERLLNDAKEGATDDLVRVGNMNTDEIAYLESIQSMEDPATDGIEEEPNAADMQQVMEAEAMPGIVPMPEGADVARPQAPMDVTPEEASE